MITIKVTKKYDEEHRSTNLVTILMQNGMNIALYISSLFALNLQGQMNL